VALEGKVVQRREEKRLEQESKRGTMRSKLRKKSHRSVELRDALGNKAK